MDCYPFLISFLSFGLTYVPPQHAHSWVAELQTQNIGNRDTILCPSIVLDVLHYIPCLQLLPVLSSRAAFSTPLSSSLSAAATARSLSPSRLSPSCSHHLQEN